MWFGGDWFLYELLLLSVSSILVSFRVFSSGHFSQISGSSSSSLWLPQFTVMSPATGTSLKKCQAFSSLKEH